MRRSCKPHCCQRCGQILFQKKYGGPGAVRCTNPECNSPRVHQIPFVFVHGCGELVPITEWIPAAKQHPDGGPLAPTSHPIPCSQCHSGDHLFIPGRSERVRDMKVVCRSAIFSSWTDSHAVAIVA